MDVIITRLFCQLLRQKAAVAINTAEMRYCWLLSDIRPTNSWDELEPLYVVFDVENFNYGI